MPTVRIRHIKKLFRPGGCLECSGFSKGEKACLAGAKADPSRVRIADVSESSVDPLARAVRHRLKRNHGIVSGIPVVLSTERPRCALVPAGNEGDNPLDYQVNCTMPFRVSHVCISCVVYPVMSWLGMAICNALNLPHTLTPPRLPYHAHRPGPICAFKILPAGDRIVYTLARRGSISQGADRHVPAIRRPSPTSAYEPSQY